MNIKQIIIVLMLLGGWCFTIDILLIKPWVYKPTPEWAVLYGISFILSFVQLVALIIYLIYLIGNTKTWEKINTWLSEPRIFKD